MYFNLNFLAFPNCLFYLLMALNFSQTFRLVHISIICATVALIALFLFLLPNNFQTIDHQTSDQIDIAAAEKRPKIELDLYDSEEWRTIATGADCDVGQFASVRREQLAQFYGQNGLYGQSKKSEFFDENSKDNFLIFASGCVKYPSANDAQYHDEVINNVQIVQSHQRNECIFETRKKQLLRSNLFLKSFNGTDTIAFFAVAKFARRQCFFLQSQDSFYGHLTFHRQNSGEILRKIQLPPIKLNKIGNGFVEFVALEQIHLNAKKGRKIPNFHQYRGLPIILAWNKQFFFPYQWDFWPSVLSYDEDPNSNCPHQCIYTTERAAESSASLLLFHVFWSNPIRFWPFFSSPRQRSEDQFYAFFTQESPYYAGWAFDKLPNDWFNMSMTYHSDSTILTKYDELENRSAETPADELWSEEEIRTRVRQKRKLALQVVSKCGTSSGRDILTAQLGELIPVDVFGWCSGKDCDEKCYRQEMESHFFYLAFENSVCPQYVTEKFWNALRALTVPVVLHRNVLRGTGVPDDAYIAADDFCNLHELAKHLLALQRDTERYMRYFNWTKMYSKRKRKNRFSPICQLCEIAHQFPRPKLTIDKRNFWSDEKCKYNFVQNDLFKCK